MITCSKKKGNNLNPVERLIWAEKLPESPDNLDLVRLLGNWPQVVYLGCG